MEKLLSSYDRFWVTAVTKSLEEEGIALFIKDENASSMGDVPPIACQQHIWLVHASDTEKARAIVEELEQRSTPSGEPWLCTECNETLEPQFTDCWQCGAPRTPS